MQKDNKFFDDLAKMASGAAGGFLEMKREIDQMVSVQLEKLLQKMNLAGQEETDALREMVAKVRMEQEDLKKRLEAAELRLETISRGKSGTN